MGGWGQSLSSVTKFICQQHLSPKNQVLHKSEFVSSNDPINTNHRTILLFGTDQFNSKLLSWRKYDHSVF